MRGVTFVPTGDIHQMLIPWSKKADELKAIIKTSYISENIKRICLEKLWKHIWQVMHLRGSLFLSLLRLENGEIKC